MVRYLVFILSVKIVVMKTDIIPGIHIVMKIFRI